MLFTVGVSGVAGSGKDTFAKLLGDSFVKQSPSTKIFFDSFAGTLRAIVKPLLDYIIGIDVYTQDRELKRIVRPALVGVAESLRISTQGRYFWKQIEDKYSNLSSEDGILIISDLRFKEYEFDELDFIKKNGVSVHILRRIEQGDQAVCTNFGGKKYLEPANEKERFNEPILLKNADFVIDCGDGECYSANTLEQVNLICNCILEKFNVASKSLK